MKLTYTFLINVLLSDCGKRPYLFLVISYRFLTVSKGVYPYGFVYLCVLTKNKYGLFVVPGKMNIGNSFVLPLKACYETGGCLLSPIKLQIIGGDFDV